MKLNQLRNLSPDNIVQIIMTTQNGNTTFSYTGPIKDVFDPEKNPIFMKWNIVITSVIFYTEQGLAYPLEGISSKVIATRPTIVFGSNVSQSDLKRYLRYIIENKYPEDRMGYVSTERPENAAERIAEIIRRNKCCKTMKNINKDTILKSFETKNYTKYTDIISPSYGTDVNYALSFLLSLEMKDKNMI